MRLHAFEMNAVGHIQQGLWRHPQDRADAYRTLDYWVDLARILERGLFDGILLADVLGVYDVFGGTPEAALRHAVQVPNGDPMLLIPAMALVTTHLGFAVTAHVGVEAPSVFARRMSTLDHLTRGRIGWNVVTGYLDSAARAMGLAAQGDHDARYDQADAFMAVVRSLWEESWGSDAVRRDRNNAVYTDPARVKSVRHEGIFAMEGMHLSEPSPQRTPVIYQAGASARGRRFAAARAECVFVNGGSVAQVAALVAQVREEAAALGRRLLVFMGITVVVAASEAAAVEKLADYESFASAAGALVQSSGSMGLDFAALGDLDVIGGPAQAVASNLAAFAGSTKADFVAGLRLGGRQVPIVGDGPAVAEALAGWMADADLDGFVLARTVAPACFVDFVDLVVPELQARGLYKTAYEAGSLRHKLFAGHAR